MMQPAPGRSDAYDRPRFRQDLVAESVDEQGARFIDVMDPDSGTIFRFYEVEYSLACGMDGERDVPGIVKWAQDELGLSPSQQEVRTVITALGELGFIATDEAAVSPPIGDLAPGASGVTVASQAKAPAAPGPSTIGSDAPAAPPPSVPDVTRGATRSTANRPVQVPDDPAPVAASRRPAPPPPPPPSPLEDDLPPISEVSINLSDHIEIRPDDVKEAVRASKVITAVNAPQEVLDLIEGRPASKAPSAPAKLPENMFQPMPEMPETATPTEIVQPPEVAIAPEIARLPEVARPLEVTRPPEVARPREIARPPDVIGIAKPPVELPAPPIAKPVPPPAPSTRVSPVLVVLLILAVLGGGAFFVWKYVLEKHDAATGAATIPPPVKPDLPPAPPPAPPAPESKIAMEAPAPDEIKLPQAGQIETILADATPVKTGEVLVKLVGDKPIEAEITGISNSIKRLGAQIDAITKRRDAAQAAGNKANVAAAEVDLAERQKVLAAKQELLSTRTADLENFLVHAQGNGTLTPVAKTGQKIAANGVVAKLQREAVPSATFQITDARPFAANASIEVAVGKGEQHVTCTISEVQSNSVKVTCPIDPSLTEGAAVTLKTAVAPAESAPSPASGSSAPNPK